MVMVFPLGKLVYGYSPLGDRVGEMVMVFLLGKLVSWLLPAEREDGLHAFSPLGERVGVWLLHAGGALEIKNKNIL